MFQAMNWFIWLSSLLMCCSSHKPTDFIKFNDAYLQQVNGSYWANIFTLLINGEYLDFKHNDFNMSKWANFFIAGKDRNSIVGFHEGQTAIWDVSGPRKIADFNILEGLSLVPQTVASDFVWVITEKLHFNSTIFLATMDLKGNMNKEPPAMEKDYEWINGRSFIWNNDIYIPYNTHESQKSLFILRIVQSPNDIVKQKVPQILAISLEILGQVMFVQSYPEPSLLIQTIFGAFLRVYSFSTILDEMKKAIENCKKGEYSANLLRLENWLRDQKVVAKNCSDQNEMLIYIYEKIEAENSFPNEPELRNAYWLGHELEKLKLVVRYGDKFHPKIRICDLNKRDGIQCSRNLSLSLETYPITKIDYVDHRKGFFVIFFGEMVRKPDLFPILECFEFTSCETCTMLGYYNPCIWSGIKCIDKRSDSNIENYQCFNGTVIYRNLTGGKFEVKISVPYELNEKFGEKVYLEISGERIDDVKYSGNKYSARNIDIYDPDNCWINFIRSTGGPMTIHLEPSSETPSDFIWISIYILSSVIIIIILIGTVVGIFNKKTNKTEAGKSVSLSSTDSKGTSPAISAMTNSSEQTENS